jgi:PP-loop superfamily ATP-utilizing enzyme
MMTTHVVQYSGGIGSWAAAKRVAARHGTTDLVLLTADTQVEDPDLWRFVHDSAAEIGVQPTIVADGRSPFEVFADVRFLGNSRLAP